MYYINIDPFRYLVDDVNNICYCCDILDRRRKYKELVIPDQIKYYGDKNYTVIGISSDSFYKNKAEGVIFPKTLKFIGNNAFRDCHNLVYVYFPDSIKKIGDCSFCSCEKLKQIVFQGDPRDINIGPSCFRCTPYLTKLEEEANNEFNLDLRPGYIGKNLVAIDNNLESLYIEPGTENVFINSAQYTLKNIYFPSGIKSFNMITDKSNKYLNFYFDSYEDLLGCHFSINFRIDNLYIKDKLIRDLNIPLGEKYLDLKVFYLMKNIHKVNLNLELETAILTNEFSYMSYMESIGPFRIDFMYVPSNLTDFRIYKKSMILNFSIKTSTANKLLRRNNYVFHFQITNLTLYIDDLSNFKKNIGYFGNNCLNWIKLVPIRDFSEDELIEILEGTKNRSIHCLCLGEEFLKLSCEDILQHTKCSIYATLSAFKEDYRERYGEKFLNRLNYFADYNKYEITSPTTCRLCCCLKEDDQNIYSGVVRVPSKTIIDGKIYNVTSISDFAFSECSYLEEVVINEDVEVGNLAFFNCPNKVKVSRIKKYINNLKIKEED